jgi:hypothetical protein
MRDDVELVSSWMVKKSSNPKEITCNIMDMLMDGSSRLSVRQMPKILANCTNYSTLGRYRACRKMVLVISFPTCLLPLLFISRRRLNSRLGTFCAGCLL